MALVAASDRRERPVKRLAALAFALLAPVLASAQYNSFMNYAAGTAPSYEGLWWNSAESGWGLSIAHQGDVLFAVWYTFDHDGSPMWLVMPDAQLANDDMGDMTGMGDMEMMMGMTRNPPMYTGTLYRSSMASKKLVMTEVGMGTVLFKDRNHGVFAYTVGDVAGSKEVTRMVFDAAAPSCSLGGAKGAAENYSDLWFNPAETGWGLNLVQQGDIVFGTYFTYDAQGKGEWLVMPDARKSGSTYSGVLARAHGPAFDAPWDSSKVSVTPIGSGSMSFQSPALGSFNLMQDGAPYARSLVRMQFAAPATVCH